MRAYAIGDIHGRLALLEAAHTLIATDAAREGAAPVIHVGDLVDRGPDSRGVVATLRAGQARGEDWVVLMGNHDRMFARFLRAPHEPEPGLRADLSWLHPRLGGAETLASWGVRAPADRPVAAVHADAAAAVTAAERAWIEGLPLHHRLGPWLFVHAGIRPGLPLDAQDDTDLVWIREPFLSDRRDHGALVVHGHTVAETVEHRGNRLNLDTGAAYGGPLSVVALDPSGVFLLTPRGRVRIDPQP